MADRTFIGQGIDCSRISGLIYRMAAWVKTNDGNVDCGQWGNLPFFREMLRTGFMFKVVICQLFKDKVRKLRRSQLSKITYPYNPI